MLKSGRVLWIVLIGFASLAAACGGDDSGPTGPTTSRPRLTGNWTGSFEGQLISSDQMSTNLQQGEDQHGERTNVDGTWSATVRLPPVPGAPTEVELTGTARGNAEGETVELSFKIDGFRDYFPEGCAIDLTGTFDATTLRGTWTTNDMCQPPAVDQGTITLMRQ